MAESTLKYKLIQMPLGISIRLEQSWDDAFIEIIDQHNVKGIILNDSWAWKHSGNLDFLFRLKDKQILELALIDATIRDLSALHGLSGLRSLYLLTHDRSEIDISFFPDLIYLGIEGKTFARSLFENRSLKMLYLRRFNSPDTNEFSKLRNLAYLELSFGPIRDIRGLAHLQALKFLKLTYLTKLQSLQGLESLSNLEELHIDTCRKINSLQPLSALNKLRILEIYNCGRLDSLKPILQLNQLVTLQLMQTTEIVDGQIDSLKQLPNLKRVVISPRKHYNIQDSEFPQESRPGLHFADPHHLLAGFHHGNSKQWN